ncbi:MAG: hypothetical protein ACLPX8_14650 [Bryobacteraceae bacterium]|jgi:hypothetical protein
MMALRVPSGWFFVLTGVIAAGMGVLAADGRAALTRANVSLDCGLVMFAFGGFPPLPAWRVRKQS